MQITAYIIPLVVAVIFLYGACKNVNVFTSFLEGAKEGMGVTFDIMPALIALVVAVGMVKESGLLDVLTWVLAPIAQWLHIPKEIIPLSLIRPISGSGALAMLESTLQTYGADSTIGRIASVLQGSTETTFYTIAVYYGACKIEKTRYTILCALLADLVGVVMSVVAVTLFFG